MNEETCDKLLAECDSDEWRHRPIHLCGLVRFSGAEFKLVVKRRGKRSRGGWVYLWTLLDGLIGSKFVIAAGTARELLDHGHVLELCASTVRPIYRNRGIYRAVLLELARLFDGSVESDIAIQPQARRAWQAIGAIEADRGGSKVMRIPGTPAQASTEA